jgi:hypothetical protein
MPIGGRQNQIHAAVASAARTILVPLGTRIGSEVAQWERAGLITLRSSDRNRPSLPGCSASVLFVKTHWRQVWKLHLPQNQFPEIEKHEVPAEIISLKQVHSKRVLKCEGP